MVNDGAVMTRTPSEDKLETTSSDFDDGGRVYFLENILDTILLPSSAFSSCLPSTIKTPSFTITFSSSGLYWLVSRLTSILLSSSLTLMTSLSLSLNMSMLAGRSVFKAGNIHRLGNIHPFSHLDLESCLIKDLLLLSLLLELVMLSCCCWFPAPEFSSMMLLDIQAML